MEESELEDYSFRAKQKIRRYFNQKEKKRFIQEQLQRQAIVFNKTKNHHFSDDEDPEEEDEDDAAIKGIPLPDLPMASDDVNEAAILAAEQFRQMHLKVEGLNGEDIAQYFDKNFTVVERILSTTQIFPVIHPRQAKQIRGKWQEDCLKVMNVLINFRKNNVCIGLAFAEQLDPENEDLADYFKVIKQPIDFIMIMNRLYNKLYQQPQEFWNDLGQVFRNCRTYYKSSKVGLRKQCDALRCLSYHLYNDWHNEQKTRFRTGVALPPPPPPNSSSQQESANQVANLKQDKALEVAPKKDSTIVNLSSLLKGQIKVNEQAPYTTQQPPQAQVIQQQPLQQQQNPVQQQQQRALMNPSPPNQMSGQQINPQNQMMTQGNMGMMDPQQQFTVQQQQQQLPQGFNDQWGGMQRNPQMPQVPNFNGLQPSQMQGQPQPQQQQQQPQQFQLPPNLPKFNQIMNTNGNTSIGFQDQMQQAMQQQQMNQMNPNMMNQNPMMFGSGQQKTQQMPGFQNINQQNPNQFGMGQNPQVDWMQGNQGMFSQGQPDQNQGIHLPSLNSLQNPNFLLNNLFMQQQQNQLGMPGQFMGMPGVQGGMPGQMDMNQFQALQQKSDQGFNLLNQMMGLQQNPNNPQGMPQGMDQLALMGQGGQDFNQFNMRQGGGAGGPTQLPSLTQLPGFNQQLGGLQLPSLNQLNSQLGSNMSTLDPFTQSNMMNMMAATGMYPLQQQQQSMFGRNLNPTSSGYNTQNAYDEMSMMLGSMGQTSNPLNTLPGGFNPFGQMDMASAQALLSGPNGAAFASSLGLTPSQFNQMTGGGMNQQQQLPQQNMNQGALVKQGHQQPQVQKTTIMDPNLIQPDINENLNDKQDPPVPPCIMDPGDYNLTWLLDSHESPSNLAISPYLTQAEIDYAIKYKHNVDQLYLVKWKGLSYTQSTWECESRVRELYEDRILDYNRFNRSLDQFQRDRLDQLIKNHKKMVRFTEKKYTSGGGNKRIDVNQENFLALQEAKINRSLLNQKIQEIMGDAFYSVVQYSEQRGIVPQFKKPHQRLKDYQVIGLNWLIRAWHEHRNVVLADEMGLGKTVMTLSLFDHLNKVYKLRGPYLILAPLTTLEHWKRIADEWTSLNSVLYYDPGSSEGRNEIRQWEWFYTDVTYKGTITQKSELYKFNIMITSFEVFMQDLNNILQEIPFIYIVVDEAHRLKNKQAKTLKLLKDHPCKRILLLTGTPVQNNTKELWTLLNYIEPEKFNSLDLFLEQYGNLESFDQIQKLHTILKPHFLRRLKEEVDNSIPPLNETVIEVGLTNLQNTYYKGIYGENRMMLAKFGTNSIKTSQLNNIDVQLRKCCNHLFLLKGVEEELTRDCKSEEDLYKKLLESSGKLMLLDKFIEKFKQENHKMLIFSQFKRMLDVIELYLRMKAIPFEKLTGSVKTQDRISAIQRFNDDKTFGVFLLTTRAGGLGINLTSARVVIIFDSDWNPQNDLQAIARAHRIGQKFEVQVYRLITSKTYEEQMFERASKKLGMEQALFSKGAFNQNEADMGTLQLRGFTELKQDSKEIEHLLKYGAYAFMDNDGEEADALYNKDIDEILATGKKKEFQYSKGLYTLQKSTFNASKYEKLPDVNDPDFWNKALPYDSIISISVLEKKFKKEKKEMAKNDKLQKEYIKDLEIVFNDFMDAKFDPKSSVASKKQLESDEEKLREILKKMVRLSGMKLLYVERCKEWLREMLRTSKRKKPMKSYISGLMDDEDGGPPAVTGAGEDYDPAFEEEDDIILYDSDNEVGNPRSLRKRQIKELQKDQSETIQQKVPGKRGRKPKRKDNNPSFDEDDEDANQGDIPQDDYGAEDQNDDYGENSSDEPESRYGLRGRRKRQKTGREEMLHQQQQKSGQSLPKINDQFAKRNEKNGIVCAWCLHPESQDRLCTWFCYGYCQRFFHEECKDDMSAASNIQDGHGAGKRLPNNALNRGIWHCDDCMDNRAVCFCCKAKGQILVFPKKGKPKAAGGTGTAGSELMNFSTALPQQIAQNTTEQLLDEDEEPLEPFDPEVVEDLDELGEVQDDDMLLEEGAEENIEEGNQDEMAQAENQDLENEYEEDQLALDKVELQDKELERSQENDNEDIKIDLDTDEAVPHLAKVDNLDQDSVGHQTPNTHTPKQQDQDAPLTLQPSPSTKIILANIKPTNSAESSPEKTIQESQPATVTQNESNDSKYVVRCTLGGCFKYYHVNCVYQNKNVSCINSMKVQRFRCPLHYCDVCHASGDSVLIVQCVKCPIAYHLKCLPQDAKAIRLTKKYIICGRHDENPENFPKYEEKAQQSSSATLAAANYNNAKDGRNLSKQQSLKTTITSSQTAIGIDKSKKKAKKRGRKPKNYLALQQLEEEEELLQQQQQQDYQLQDDQFEEEKYPLAYETQEPKGKQGSFMITLPEQSNPLRNDSSSQNLQSPRGAHSIKIMASNSNINTTGIISREYPKPLFAVEKHHSHARSQSGMNKKSSTQLNNEY